jgi:catechol 2,3-dioxygenase-like lactoylglutathione lyase family enzyme
MASPVHPAAAEPAESSLLRAVPALPVLGIPRAVEFYEQRLGFRRVFADDGYGIVQRDHVEIHLWAANGPPGSGAEPHLAGTASCRVQVGSIDGLYDEYRGQDVLHGGGELSPQPWGTREFAVVDLDNNLLTFFEPTEDVSGST